MDESEFDEDGNPYYTYVDAPEPTACERLNEAMAELAATDYYALKYIDGELREEEYASIRDERARLRQRVRELEAEQAAEMSGGD
jgi:hypothetical protein|nr:MAG TPA: zipper dimerization domain transcription factor-like protein [Caudoviricetes sp.]